MQRNVKIQFNAAVTKICQLAAQIMSKPSAHTHRQRETGGFEGSHKVRSSHTPTHTNTHQLTPAHTPFVL